jgi:hypothetical protein
MRLGREVARMGTTSSQEAANAQGAEGANRTMTV